MLTAKSLFYGRRVRDILFIIFFKWKRHHDDILKVYMEKYAKYNIYIRISCFNLDIKTQMKWYQIGRIVILNNNVFRYVSIPIIHTLLRDIIY